MLKIDDSFITGIDDIDAQHKFLFDAINSLANFNNNRENLWFVICEIEEYASVHFQTEEKYMIDFNYPHIDDHIKEHRAFSKRYNVLKEELTEHGMTDDFLERLRFFLVSWIIAHYTNIDIKMVNFIKSTKSL